MSSNGRLALAALVALACAPFALAGCGAQSIAVAATPTVTTAPAATATTTTPAGPTTCQSASLTLALLSTGDASGRTRDVYQFTNSGAAPCTLTGYPGVTGMDPSVAITQTTSAYMWNTATITTLTLAPSGTAVFAIQVQPTAELTGQTCLTATPTFTPPGGATGLAAPSPITTCDGTLSISPLVATPDAL